MTARATRQRARRHVRRGRVVAFVALLLTACQGGGTPPPPPVSFPPSPPHAASPIDGYVHTSGTEFIDDGAKVVQLRGVNEPAMVRGSGRSLTVGGDACGEGWAVPPTSEWDAIAAAGFNSVRLAVSWANLEPAPPTADGSGGLIHQWNQPYLAGLDEIVSELAQRHLAVILDMHQEKWSPAVKSPTLPGAMRCEGAGMPVWLYPTTVEGNLGANVLQCEFYQRTAAPGLPETPQDGFAAAWSFLAGRYAGNPAVVGADILNEPAPHNTCTVEQLDLTAFYDLVGGALHSANPKLLVICEDNLYSSYVSVGFAMIAPPHVPNWVYSWHFYPSDWATGGPALQAHVDRARAWNVPLYIGEFNPMVGAGGGVPADWQAIFSQSMQFFTQNQLSWAFWNYGSLFVRPPLPDRLVLLKGLQAGL